MSIYVIDSNIDDMGGVERIVNTLSNNLSTIYDVKVVSEYKTRKTSFFEYDSHIKRNYFINDMKIIKDNTKFKHYVNRSISILKEKMLLNKKINRFLKTISKDDILIFGRVTVALDFLPIVEKLKLTNVIIVRDGTHLICYNDNTKRKMKKYFPKFVNTFVVSSDESINKYESFFGKSRMKLVKIYNPLGIKVNYKYDEESKTIISVGRICMQKGFDALIDAFSIVIKKHSDWKLKIYGNGDLEKNIKNKINDLNISNNVLLLNGTKDVVKAYNESSIFVCSSRFEGYANTLVEAGACGLPLISYDWLMGVEEIIKDNENGKIVRLSNRYNYFKGENETIDIKNLAETINQFIEDKETRMMYSLKNKKKFDNRNLDIIIKEWVKLIKSTGVNKNENNN